MNAVQQMQEVLYNELLKLNKKGNSEPFNFWVVQGGRNGLYFRFNRGGNPDNINQGYTDVGIVKVGSNSRLQFAGFFFSKSFNKCVFRISNRPQSDISFFKYVANKAGLPIPSLNELTAFVNAIMPLANQLAPSYMPFDANLMNWMEHVYNVFFAEIKKYDQKNTTNFYELLKIDDAYFGALRSYNDKLYAKNSVNSPASPVAINFTTNHLANTGTSTSRPPIIPLNQILYGPPGTGKTYHTIDMAVDILDSNMAGKSWDEKKKAFDKFKKDGRIVFTTFHQSMSYEDFIEGIKPETNDNTKQVEYPVKNGVFKQLCTEAVSHPEQNYVMIIDEINRGNVSQIFGELITLLEEDKRLGNDFELTVKLPYSSHNNDNEFGVPSNLFIIGTMNTADRSVEALDTALRRRFSFVEMMPDPELLNNNVINGHSMKELLETINRRIEVLKDREHQIGHSYFMKCTTMDELEAVFKNKIIPLLQEYFYGNYESILCVLGDGFVKADNISSMTFARGSSYDGDLSKPQYRLLNDNEWKTFDFDKAIEGIIQ